MALLSVIRRWALRDLGDHGAEPAVAQALLEASQDRLLVARLDVDNSNRGHSRLGKRRGKQILAGNAPEHLAPSSRRNSGGEQRRRGAVDRTVPAARDLLYLFLP